MNFKDKRMLIIGSGAFLLVLTFMLFFTLQSKDNMMSNTGRYSGDITLGDTIDHCTEYNWVLQSAVSGFKASCTAVPKNNNNDMYRTCEEIEDENLCSANGISNTICYYSKEYKRENCQTCENGYSGATCQPNQTSTATLKCHDRTYSGEGQMIAECTNCHITDVSDFASGMNRDNVYVMNVNQYTVTAIPDEGYTLSPNTCTATISCDAGQEPDGNGGCKACADGYYKSSIGNYSCSKCEGTVYSNKTACTSNTGKCCILKDGVYTYGTYSSTDQCVGGLTETIASCAARNNPDTSCNHENQYEIGGECITCSSGYIATADNKKCHIVVKAGSYLAVASGTDIRSCPAGTYSEGTTIEYGEVSTCQNCPYDRPSSPIGSTSLADCKPLTGTCSVLISTDATLVSNGSHYNVSVSVNGDGCNGRTLSLSTTNAEISGSNTSWPVSDGQNFNAIVVTQHAKCNQYSTVVARLSGSGGISSNSIRVAGQDDWVCETDEEPYSKWPEATYSSKYHSRSAAENAGAIEYYDQLDKSYYAEYCHRGCNSSGSGSESPKCYVKADSINGNSYCTGTSSECSGYRVSGKSVENCDETIACYINNSNGLYVTGDYENVDGYTPTGSTECPEIRCYRLSDGTYSWTNNPGAGAVWISSIDNRPDCENPSGEYKCYINISTNDYKWSTSSPGTGYEADDTINKPGACTPAERPGCYVNALTGKHDWGLYEKVTGYVLVPGIDDDKKCNDTIPDVPKTDLNPSMIIYISVIVLCSFGMAFAVYAYRRQERNVN